jgi:chemotaxis protein methyltransferase CheR
MNTDDMSGSARNQNDESGGLSGAAFQRLAGFFLSQSGIRLQPGKRFLVASRLRTRLENLKLSSFEDYCTYLQRPEHSDERRCAVDLLTTNETFFFREAMHFDFLRQHAREQMRGRSLACWSAACSSGEEPYSIAMTLRDVRPHGDFSITASDLSQRVIDRAERGVFTMQRIQAFPAGYLQKYCMKGTGKYEGMLKVRSEIRDSVRFTHHNLMQSAQALGRFDVVFLRNALIYFDIPEKQIILGHILDVMAKDALLIVGRSESLLGVNVPLTRVDGSVYRRS